VVVGESHLNYIAREFLRYYHEFRPHQGVGNVTLNCASTKDPPTESVSTEPGEIVCDEWLGGLLKSYRRAA
jgi:hypothetical protein